MELSTTLAAQLATLGGTALDLPDAVERLNGMLLAAVPSAIGISITVHVSDVDLTLTTLPGDVEPQASLRVPLSLWAEFGPGSEVVFYSSAAGSLVDLAAELGWALELTIAWTRQSADRVLVVDQHLTPAPGLSGLDDLSAVNKAVGVLLSRGRSPEVAIEDLQRAAWLADSSIGAAARVLMGGLRGPVAPQFVDLAALPVRARWDGKARPGDHLCGLYRGEDQRDEMMLPYLRAGLSNGDHCLCLIDRTDPAVIRERLWPDAAATDISQLDIRSASAVYLQYGDFVAEEMLGFLEQKAVEVSVTGGGRHFRATGEMSWAMANPQNFEQFFTYEAELNRMTSEHAPALLCMFDLDDLDGAALDNVLRTHPTIVYGEDIIDNPYFRGPDHLVAAAGTEPRD